MASLESLANATIPLSWEEKKGTPAWHPLSLWQMLLPNQADMYYCPPVLIIFHSLLILLHSSLSKITIAVKIITNGLLLKIL